MKNRIMAWVSVNASVIGVTVLTIVTVLMITGCGTVAGIGKDIQTSAEWTKEKISGDKK
jgi:predicted small secreted protein